MFSCLLCEKMSRDDLERLLAGCTRRTDDRAKSSQAGGVTVVFYVERGSCVKEPCLECWTCLLVVFVGFGAKRGIVLGGWVVYVVSQERHLDGVKEWSTKNS